MPAKSKSQQRLFAMVHAYNKGEFHGSRSLRNRVAAMSRRISDEDARDFARTSHDGLPERKEEKKAQALVRPETVERMYDQYPVGEYAGSLVPVSTRSERRRSFLGSVLYGTGAGAIVGGVSAAGLGALIAYGASRYADPSLSAATTKAVSAARRQKSMRPSRAAGAFLGSLFSAGKRKGAVDSSEVRRRMLEAAAKLGVVGAGAGATAGAVAGAGFGAWDKLRG